MILRLFAVGALLAAVVPAWAQGAPRYGSLELAGGVRLEFALVLPDGHDPSRAYPTLLALPPGPQTRRMVEASLSRYWGRQAARAGWVVVSPVAPEGVLFFQGSERHIPALLEHIESEHQLEGGRFHLAGSSNGGRSAFRIALAQPDRFHSLIALPGYPPAEGDLAGLERLVDKPVRLFVGGEDRGWIEPMRDVERRLAELGGDVRLEILPGEGHVPASLDGGRIMEVLETVRAKLRETDGKAEKVEVAAVLDALHEAASRAEGERYFGLFSPNAVFFGTDPAERWSLEQFRAYAEPFFTRGQGWTYRVASRHLELAPGGATAWFDEELDNEKYGRCRGTGVLVKTVDGWKIAQYNLSIPVPNDLAAKVVEWIRQGE